MDSPIFIIWLILVSLILAFVVHFLQQKIGFKRKILYIIFTVLLGVALVLGLISYIVGGWTGLGLGALSIYTLVPSITTLIILKLMEKS